MKCLIVVDLPVARTGMKRLIESHPDLRLAGSFDNAVAALQALPDSGAKLIFTDIKMPGLSGMDFARLLPSDVMVIFTTAYSEYAVVSYDIGVIDYLVKPIEPLRFERAVAKALAMEKARSHIASIQDEEILTVKSDRRFIRIPFADILYLEGNKDLVLIHLQDHTLTTRATLRSVEEMLPVEKFIRVNKSFIVNRKKITAFDSSDILIGRREIAIGPTYRDSVMASLIP